MREITVGVVAPAYVNVPLWIAQERGFLERRGLAATERICGTTHGVTNALRNGEVDIALTAPEGSIADAVAGGPLRVVNDQWITPTYTANAAQAIVRLALAGVTGTVHVTNAGGCTWHAFAAEAVRLTGLGVPVEAVSASAYPSKARRPPNSALQTDRLSGLLGRPPRAWREALAAYLREKGHIS